ncbi:hypothetical protein MAX38_20985 [Escherichia coli]
MNKTKGCLIANFATVPTYEYNRNLTLKLSVQNLMNRDYSEALNKLNMMPGLGDETHPANSARGRTWIFGGDIRF